MSPLATAYAPVVQRIELWTPKPPMAVRFGPGVWAVAGRIFRIKNKRELCFAPGVTDDKKTRSLALLDKSVPIKKLCFRDVVYR